MKRYGHLFEKICDIENLRKAHKNAKKGKGWYKEVQEIDKDPDKYLEQIQEMLIQGIISSGHARALLSLDGGGLQLKAAKEIIEKSLSVRETERLVKRMAKEAAGEEKKEKKADDALMLIYQNLEDRMKTIMGTKVSIHNKDKNKGRIEIEYYSEAELERIVELIESIH